MFLKLHDHIHHVALAGPAGAPKLVLLHSLGTSSAVWQSQVAALAGRYRVICPDFRGHGLSEVSRTGLSIEALAADVLELLAQLEVESFALAGISLGGVVAQAVAVQAGARVQGLALFDSYVSTANPQMWIDRADKVRRDGLGAISDAVLDLWMPSPDRDTPEGIGLSRMLAATADEGYAAGCDALASADNRAVIGTVHAPTVVACGALDRAAPPAASQLLAGLIPNARVEIVDGAAHIPLLHHDRRCTEIISSVL